MNIEQVLLYGSVIFAVSIVPGPSMALAFREGAIHKMQGVIPSALGNMFASLIQGVIAYLVFKSVVSINENFILLIQVFGSLYISYIGYIFIRNSAKFSLTEETNDNYGFSYIANLQTGFLVAFFNPKAILFFSAIFPQFTSSIEMKIFNEIIYIFMPIGSIAFICFIIYGVCGAASIKIFKNGAVIEYMIKILGVLLIISALMGFLGVFL